MRSLYILFFALAAGCFLCPHRVIAQSADSLYAPGIVLCKLKDASSGILDTAGPQNLILKQLFQKFGVTKYEQAAKGISSRSDRLYRLYLRTSAADSMIEALQVLPNMEFAEHMPIFWINDVPNDFKPVDQYFLSVVKAPDAWDENRGSPEVTVAIIDNCVLTRHEDLGANIWVNKGEIPDNNIDDDQNGFIDDVNGYDMADDDNDPNPPAGITDTTPWIHGTHCAGISSAVTDNDRGVASIGRNLKIMAVKATRDSDNPRMLRNGFDGIVYAISAGADIISISFGTTNNSASIKMLMEEALLYGIVVVAAAGNSASDQPQYPAGYPHVISVAATDMDDKKADFSSYGKWVTICAPGVGIRSTFSGSPSSYGAISGTSMSTPLVAGLAGLILSKYPNLSPLQVQEQIKRTADNIDRLNPDYAGQLGGGRINAARALGGLSVGDFRERSVIQVYPNPVGRGDELQVRTEGGVNCILTLTDLEGRILLTHQTQGRDAFGLPLSGLEAGMYILRCQTAGKQEVVQRVVVY